MTWKPASAETVKEIVAGDLARCDSKQIAVFEKYRTEPYLGPITRYGKNETVYIVARKDREVIYWEDVEEGFERSAVADDGRILEHGCNQNDLGLALNAWIEEE